MSWTNLCIEAFCFGNTDKDNNYPCGRSCPSHLCLEDGHCPHFAYGKTTERDVAQFPPLRLIIKDRLGIWLNDLYRELRWWFWDSLWFNRRKMRQWFDSIETISSKDCSVLAEYENEQKENEKKFVEWIKNVTEGIEPYKEKEGD